MRIVAAPASIPLHAPISRPYITPPRYAASLPRFGRPVVAYERKPIVRMLALIVATSVLLGDSRPRLLAL